MLFIKALHRHKSSVCLLRWCDNHELRLCSVDTNGTIIFWDVSEGSVLSVISGTKELKTVEAIEFIEVNSNNDNDVKTYNLLVLYRNNILILYETEFGEKIWTKRFDLNITAFSLDPFCKTNILFGIKFKDISFAIVDDLRPDKAPNRPMKKFAVDVIHNSPNNLVKNNGSVQKYSLSVKSDPINSSNDSSALQTEWTDICYHRSVRSQVLLSFPREVLVIDVSIEAIVCCVPLERNCSNLLHVFSCALRNAFFICHDFGVVSLRLFQKQFSFDENEELNSIAISYQNVCQSDGLRLIKQNKIYGFCMSPTDETRVALLLNNGRLIIKTIHKLGSKSIETLQSIPYICDIIHRDQYLCGQSKAKSHRLLMSHLLPALSSGPHVIRMCPAVTVRNWPVHKPLLAVGDSSGTIQVWHLLHCSLEREFSIHSYPVRGIEWTSLQTIISFAFPNISPHSGKTNNELNITEVISGRTQPLRTEKNSDSSPIEALRISHLKQYLIIAFKEDPFEIWDLKSLTLLRVMPKQFSAVTALEWSPLYNKRIETNISNTYLNAMPYQLHSKENFVITNSTGELYHFSIEGNIVKEITCIPPDTEMSANITCIAWKSDQVLLGDAAGNLNVWDLKKKVSKIEPTHRGAIKKLRFGPGRGNMKFMILYNDGVDIWDIKDFKLTSQIKSPRDMSFKVVDIDWASSDRPILCTSEGVILISDMKLRQYTSAMSQLLNETLSDDIDLSATNFDLMSRMSRFIFRSKLAFNQWHGSQKLPECDIERNLLISKMFNDMDGYRLWNIVSYVVNEQKERLDQNYDILLDNESFKEIQSEKLSLLDTLRTSYNHNKISYEMLILLNRPQRAVQLLLETEPSMTDYYTDALRACLVAALHSEGHNSTAQPVVKLVATNLIANGKVDEGSQLLCLINKAQDACRYLQSGGKWMSSVVLAKVSFQFACQCASSLVPLSLLYLTIDFHLVCSEWQRLCGSNESMGSASDRKQ